MTLPAEDLPGLCAEHTSREQPSQVSVAYPATRVADPRFRPRWAPGQSEALERGIQLRVPGRGNITDDDPVPDDVDPRARRQPDEFRPHQAEADPPTCRDLSVLGQDRQQEEILAERAQDIRGLRL